MGCTDCKDYLSMLGLQVVYDHYWKDANIPLIGVIELTYQCNFRCIHCYASNQHNHPYLPYEQITQLIDEMVESGTLILTFSGGDPLAHPDFSRIYKYVRKNGIFVEIFTNGALINDSIIDLFKEYPPMNIDITVYGASDETYRSVAGVKDGFKTVKHSIELLKANDIKFTLKTCVIKENMADLFAIKKYAEDLGVDYRYSFDIAPTIEGDTSVRKHMLLPKEIIDMERRDPKRVSQWAKQSLASIDDVPYYELPIFNCKTGKFTFCVSADGFLSGCIHDRSNLFDLGEGSFIEGWLLINKKIHEPLITPEYPCASCEYLPFCNTCPADSQREYGSPQIVNTNQCALAKLRYETFSRKEDISDGI